MVVLYKVWKKYNEIQSTKNKMHLNNRKNEKIIHAPSPSGEPWTSSIRPPVTNGEPWTSSI